MGPIADRYHRQRLLPEVGDAGQARLAAARVLVVGVGALGCQVADLLARAGVGHLRLVDRDVVEASNLQRQTLYAQADVGCAKAEAARRRLLAINSAVRVEALAVDATADTARGLARMDGGPPHVIADGTDNFETRLLLNDLAVELGVPYAYGGVIASRGMAATFLPPTAAGLPPTAAGAGAHATGCLRCVMRHAPPAASVPTCDTAGVLGPAVALVAAHQAADALKVLLGRADLLSGEMLEFDLMAGRLRRLSLADLAAPGPCPCCQGGRRDALDGHAAGAAPAATALCGRNAVQVCPAGAGRVDLAALERRLAALGPCQRVGGLVRAEVHREGGGPGAGEPWRLTVFADGRAIIAGTEDPAVARGLYARLIGA